MGGTIPESVATVELTPLLAGLIVVPDMLFEKFV
jgi:hypothetical protein